MSFAFGRLQYSAQCLLFSPPLSLLTHSGHVCHLATHATETAQTLSCNIQTRNHCEIWEWPVKYLHKWCQAPPSAEGAPQLQCQRVQGQFVNWEYAWSSWSKACSWCNTCTDRYFSSGSELTGWVSYNPFFGDTPSWLDREFGLHVHLG